MIPVSYCAYLNLHIKRKIRKINSNEKEDEVSMSGSRLSYGGRDAHRMYEGAGGEEDREDRR